MKNGKHIIKNQREIIKFIQEGKLTYKVKYFISTGFYLFGFLIKTSNKKHTSNLSFYNLEDAEWYAQHTYKCDTPAASYTDWRFNPYFIGTEHLNKYGKIEIKVSTKKNLYFVFNSEHEQYLDDFPSFKNHFNEYIENISNQCLDTCQVVSRFDVLAMKSVPIDQLNTASKEIDDLNNFLKNYKDAQQQNQQFLEKIINQLNYGKEIQ